MSEEVGSEEMAVGQKENPSAVPEGSCVYVSANRTARLPTFGQGKPPTSRMGLEWGAGGWRSGTSWRHLTAWRKAGQVFFLQSCILCGSED